MGIQSSINSLLSQAQRLATFYKGFDKAEKIIGDTTATKNEAQIQTDIAAGNAPMKDGKVDSEWLQKRRDEYQKSKIDEFYKNYKPTKEIYKRSFHNSNGNLTNAYGKINALNLQEKVKRGIELDSDEKEFYNDPRVQEYLKSQSTNSELKNEVASDLARASVEARTNSINKTKSNFNAHTASLIKYYSKGSGNP